MKNEHAWLNQNKNDSLINASAKEKAENDAAAEKARYIDEILGRNESKKISHEIKEDRPEIENIGKQIFVTERQLKKLRENGEVTLNGVHLYETTIPPNQKFILQGEHMEGVEVELVEIIKKNSSGGATIKVKLSSTRSHIN